MAKKSRADSKADEPDGPEWPAGMPYTVYFPRRGGYAAGDIEYTTPLPRVGDMIEYLDQQGASHWYVVAEVVHTLQSSPAEAPDGIRLLRAGIPAVYLARSRRKAPRRG